MLLDLGVSLGKSCKEGPLVADDLALGRYGDAVLVKGVDTAGLGVDRLTMLLTGLAIKDAMFLFRGPNRLNP